MKENTIYYFKSTSHVILVSISMMLSINLFIQFSNYIHIKILLGSVAFSMELIKVYLLVESKHHISLKTTKKYILGSLEFLVYLGLAIASIVASLGFTLVSIEEQSLQFQTQRTVSNFQIDYIVDEIDANNRQIGIIQENASNLAFSAVERNEEANRQIREIQEKNRELITEVESLREEQSEVAFNQDRLTSVDMFNLLGEIVNTSGRNMMFYLMLAIVFMLEIAIAVTSGSIQVDNIENKYEFMAYIEELFNVNGKRLNKDKDVSKKTGIDFIDCKRYREILLNSHYNNIPLIETGRGGTKANFTSSQVKQIVKMQSSLGINERRRKK